MQQKKNKKIKREELMKRKNKKAKKKYDKSGYFCVSSQYVKHYM